MPPPTRSPLRSAVLGGLLVVGVAGCTADGASRAAPLDRATGAVLADAAERLAAAIEDGDPCQAIAEVDELRARADAARQAGEAPEEVVTETVRVARAVTAGVVCDDGPVALDEDAPAGADGTEDAAGEAPADATDGEAEAAPAPAAPAGAPDGEEEATEPDAPSASGDGDRSGGNSNAGGSGSAGGNSNAAGNSNAGGNSAGGNSNAGGNSAGGNGNGRGNGGRG